MNKDNPHVSLYLLNTALLSTHEIDSAFWKEWELFGLPGGIQVFLVLNLLLLLAVLYGFGQLLRGARSGQMFALLLAAGGVFAFVIHGYFILTGHREFTLPVSMALLVAILVVSLIQGVQALKALRTKV